MGGALLAGCWLAAPQAHGAADGSSTRSGPVYYRAGQVSTITNELAPLASVLIQTLVESVPAGWAATNISDGGAWIPELGTVRWMFFDNQVRRLRFDLVAPTDATAPAVLSGQASFDGETVAVLGLAGLLPEPPASGTVSRSLPATCRPGTNLTVYLRVQPDPGIQIHAVTEVLPAGWHAGGISDGGVEPVAGRIRWGPFLDGDARVLSYTAQVPADAAGAHGFAGEGTFEAAVVAVAGSSTVTVVPPVGGTGTRRLPASYLGGVPVDVLLDIVPEPGTAFHAVSETPPAGWTVRNVSHAGVFAADLGRIQWGPFPDPLPRALTYEVVPPTNAATTACFTGQVLFDATLGTIGGDTCLDAALVGGGTVRRTLPLDYRADELVSVVLDVAPAGGVAAQGIEETVPDGWVVEPGSVGVGGVIDAGASTTVRWLFLDDAPRALTYSVRPPAVPGAGATFAGQGTFDAVVVATAGSAAMRLAPGGGASRQLPAFYVPGVSFPVTVAVTPNAGVGLVAVAEVPPAGWVPRAIALGGVYDASDGTIRWVTPPTGGSLALSYTLDPPADATQPGCFAGTVLFDANAATVGGVATLPPNLPPAVSAIPALTTLEDVPVLIAFTISDAETPVNQLDVGLAHTNSWLLPAGGIELNRVGDMFYLALAPAAGLSGTDRFTLTVSDGVSTVTRVFTLWVEPVNHPPVPTPVADQQVDAGALLSLRLTAADVETASNLLAFSLVQGPAGMAVAPNGLLTWLTSPTQTPGPYFVTFRVTDGGAPPALADGSFVVTVRSVAPLVVAGADVLYCNPQGQGKVAITALLTNDTSVPGQALRLVSVSSPSALGATVRVQGNWVLYAGPAGGTGVDYFTYRVQDASGNQANGLVRVYPSESASRLNQLSLTADANGVVHVVFVGIPGRLYRILMAPSLPAATWIPIGQIRASDYNGQFEFVDLGAAGQPQRYYRTSE